MADTPDLGSGTEKCVGSSPTRRTVFSRTADACRPAAAPEALSRSLVPRSLRCWRVVMRIPALAFSWLQLRCRCCCMCGVSLACSIAVAVVPERRELLYTRRKRLGREGSEPEAIDHVGSRGSRPEVSSETRERPSDADMDGHGGLRGLFG